MDDTALHALLFIAHFHQLPVDKEQLIHYLGKSGIAFTQTDLLLAAKAIGLSARTFNLPPDKIQPDMLPAIIKSSAGDYSILASINNQSKEKHRHTYLIHDIQNATPRLLPHGDFITSYTEEMILLTRRHIFSENIKRHFDLSWFVPSLVKYRTMFGEVLIASFCLQALALVTPLFFQVIMDKVLVHRGFTTLNILAIGFLIIVLFEAFMGCFRDYLFSHTTNRVDVELGSRLFKHLLSLPLSYFESRAVGQQVARVRELETIRQFITGSTLTLFIDLFFVFIFLGVMWYYSPTLTWIVLAAFPAYFILSFFITPILRHRLDEKFTHAAENTAFLTETMTGIGTVKSMAIEPLMIRRLEAVLSRYVHASFRSQHLGHIANHIAFTINKLMMLAIIWWGAHLVIDGNLTVGQLIAFNMLSGRVSGPLLRLVQLWQDVQQASIAIARLGDILNCPSEPGFNPTRSRMPALQGGVTFENVVFRYRIDGPVTLDHLNLAVSPGEVIGIVGRSGSGKSTITKLIQRLYVPNAGAVLVDGVDLATMDTAWLRRQIGVVMQDNILFNRSIRENIALIDPSTPMEQVVEAAKMAGAHEFISRLQDGYDTLVGEFGSTLSGGQRQRIAIARALIGNPRILIFDEATSALDYESERVIQDNMANICRGRTVFIIAHRLSTVRLCDRIIVMEQGCIVEQGTHDKLLQHNGYYAALDRAQMISPSHTSSHRSSDGVIVSHPERHSFRVVTRPSHHQEHC
ncbi:TPA: type I secretion system permease/ATPase [Aeromonas dhakensis]|nr:type I secretion system permease/ATPase [Aeromonas dhakensis]